MDLNTAFNQFKHGLVHDSVLAMPNFDANFVVETNASNVAVGATWSTSYLHIKSAHLCII